MECKQADGFTLRYAEKTIEPNDAKNLAKHLMECENCRKSFTVFDMCLEEADLVEAPADFTQKVMAKVGGIKKESAGMPYAFRVLWGLSAVFFGAVLLLVLNTTAFLDYSAERLESMNSVLRPFFENISASLAQIEYFGVITFLFVPLLGILLYVLHSGEKSVKA